MNGQSPINLNTTRSTVIPDSRLAVAKEREVTPNTSRPYSPLAALLTPFKQVTEPQPGLLAEKQSQTPAWLAFADLRTTAAPPETRAEEAQEKIEEVAEESLEPTATKKAKPGQLYGVSFEEDIK